MHLVVPGPLDQRTGGYLYDARMVEGLRALAREVKVHSVRGRFPDVDRVARDALAATLDGLPDGALAVVDGLALCALPEVAEAAAERLRLVALVHHPLGDETGLDPATRDHLLALEARTLAAVAGVIVTSHFTRSRLGELGVAESRVEAVLPGTERPPRLDTDGAPGRAVANSADGAALHLLCVGTVTPRKGQDLLVQALGCLGDLQWRCTCAGSVERDPEYAAGVRGAAAAHGLGDRITFAGELEAAALEELYASADVFVLPSWYEGYGMALTEALIRGLPVVSTRGGAIPWTVPETAGVLVAPGRADELAEALRGVLEDGERRAGLAAAARAHGEGLPGWDAQAARFAAALDRFSRATG